MPLLDFFKKKKDNKPEIIPQPEHDVNFGKPPIILALEKELNCSFELVELNKIQEWKDEKTFEYSVDDTGNIIGIAITNNDLEKIPSAFVETRHALSLREYLTILDLSYNNISDISPLKELTNIQELGLYRNKISDISPLSSLTNLQKLILSENQINYISFLSCLTNLQTLILANNPIIDIFPLSGLTNLQTLVLYKIEINDISPLSALKNLQTLSLRNIQISDISPLSSLTNLQTLYIDTNQIIDISPLSGLKNLQTLWLHENQISDISPLKELTNLQILFLHENQISNISHLKELTNIQKLFLRSNQISDISPLKGLTNIQELDLEKNQIIDISPLSGLKNLQELDLRFNPIDILPEWICDFPEMDILCEDKYKYGFISIFGNPIENIPLTIVEQGKAAVKKYFEELKKEQQQYNFEVKLMLIGEGGTGKTSVLRKLVDKNNELPNAADTTLGIDIQKWNFPLNKALFEHLPALKQENMQVNIWDLGGQRIYHGTHQIFFGENTFYILVEDTRRFKTDFSYWLNTVEQLAGENANLMIVINENDNRTVKFDSEGFRSRFLFLKEIYNIDLIKTDASIVRFQEFIKNAIQHLPNVGTPLPASYIRIKEALFNTQKNYISLDAFLEICSEQGISEFDSVRVLSKYLHETGAITHFIDDEVLQNRIFLNSEWLVKTLYKVLDEQSIKDGKGRISKEEVCKIWRAENLGFEINSLTQLMHKFGLMYKVKDKDEYVIPAHLPTEKPYAAWAHQSKGQTLLFKYEFGKYMPEGLMSHLIVSLHTYIESEQNVWHRGVNLVYEKSFAEIVETYGEINTFEIKISGSQKREMLAIIRQHFKEVIKPFKKLYYKELIPCNCRECNESAEPHFYIFESLRKRIEKNIYKVQCDKSYEEIDVRNLVDSVILKEDFVDIKQLIAEDKLEKALNEALKVAHKQKDAEKVKKILLQQSRYKKNENSNHNGTISREEYLRTNNQIKEALLEMLD